MNTIPTSSPIEIEKRILTLRGIQVLLDRDLAEMYQVETRVLNQAVKRNNERFPELFHFQLTDQEKSELVTNCDRFMSLKHTSNNGSVLKYALWQLVASTKLIQSVSNSQHKSGLFHRPPYFTRYLIPK